MPTPPDSFPESGRAPVGPGRRRNVRGLALLIVTILIIGGLYFVLTHPEVTPQELTQAQLFELIKADRVTKLINEPDPSTGIRNLVGTYRKPVSSVPGAPLAGEGAFKVPVDLQLDPYLLSEIKQAGYTGTIETQNNSNIMWPLLIQLVPVVILFALIGILALATIVVVIKLAWRYGPGDVK